MARPYPSRLAHLVLLATIGALCIGCQGGFGAACDSSRECPGLVCDVALGTCAECVVDSDCLSADTTCVEARCEARTPCESSRQCPGLVCHPTLGHCSECVSSEECAGAEVCTDGRCRPPETGCRADADCTSGVCDPEGQVCVECLSDTQCDAARRCDEALRCVPRVDGGSVDGGSAPPDAGQGDSGRPDSGPPGSDAGLVDAGPDGGATDAGAPPLDAGPPPLDAGPPLPDAGPPPVDSGPPPVDGGPPPPDAGSCGVPATACVQGSEGRNTCATARTVSRVAAGLGHTISASHCGATDDYDDTEPACWDAGPDHAYRIFMLAGESLALDYASLGECTSSSPVLLTLRVFEAGPGCAASDCSFPSTYCSSRDEVQSTTHVATHSGWVYVLADVSTAFDDSGNYTLRFDLECNSPDCGC